jgi:PPOX class probable F420-dependent enzyme
VEPTAARALLAAARVATLGTVAPSGRPHLVPVCLAVDGDTIYSVVDGKPKRTAQLQRLANVRGEPRACVLADGYDEDWSRLWWARADGRAAVVEPHEPGREHGLALLAARYPQYRESPPGGSLLVISVERWSGWRAV